MILIDSTVYIDWLRGRVELKEILEPWINARAIVFCGVIRAEVIRGVLSPRQKERINELFDALQEITTDDGIWRDASELAWRLDRAGVVLPLTDLVIAACAKRVKATVVTTDEHFSKIPGLKVRSDVPLFE